ncbi:MAG: ABC transporter permease [Clostridia bacterium]
MNKFKLFFVSIGNWFKKVFTIIGNWFKKVFTIIGSWFKKVFTLVGNWFKKVFTPVGNWFKKVFTPVGSWFKKVFTPVGSWIKKLFIINGNKTKFGKLLTSSSSKSLYASLICILSGILIGFLLLLITSLASPNISLGNAFDGFRVIIGSIFYKKTVDGVLIFGINANSIGDMIFRATPVLMTGLSVAFAFKSGLFNIGASGQYLMGTAASLYIALSIPQTVPVWLIWIFAFFGAIIAGMLWGAIPGLFKTLFNTNEVITCIMTNWIAANLVTMLFDGSALRNITEAGKSGYIKPTSANGVFNPSFGIRGLFEGSYADGGIVIAIFIAILIYFIINKSKFGYELRATGLNRRATKYAGMREKRNIIFSMAIAGGLAAAGAALYWLNGRTEFAWNTSTSLPIEGFNGIPVALLASSNPIGIIFASLFMAFLNIGGVKLSVATAFNEHIAGIIVAIIVYFSGFSKFFVDLFNSNKKVKHKLNLTAIADGQTATLSQNIESQDVESQNIESQDVEVKIINEEIPNENTKEEADK